MHIIVNGRETDLPEGATVRSLLESMELDPDSVVVELNGDIVPGERFADTGLHPDDTLEILRFVGGG